MGVTKRRKSVPHPAADDLLSELAGHLGTLTPPELTRAAQAANLHPNTLYSVMRRTTRPTLDSTCALFAHFGLSLQLQTRRD